MRSTTPNEGTPAQSQPESPKEFEFIAAVQDEKVPNEHKFHAAQHHNYTIGEQPKTSGSDRQCMAALVKVNGLEAYALVDSGSMTVSVTHDFA